MGRRIVDLNETPTVDDVDDVVVEDVDVGSMNSKELDLLAQFENNNVDNVPSHVVAKSGVKSDRSSSKINFLSETPLPRMDGYVDLLRRVSRTASAQAAGRPLALGPFPASANGKNVRAWQLMGLQAALAVKGRREVQPITPPWLPSAYQPSLCKTCGDTKHQKQQVKMKATDVVIEAPKQLKRKASETVEVVEKKQNNKCKN